MEMKYLTKQLKTIRFHPAKDGGFALVSTDNCSHNGDKLKAGVMAYVDAWKQAGKVDDDFVSYMEEKVSFPWSMIDKNHTKTG